MNYSPKRNEPKKQSAFLVDIFLTLLIVLSAAFIGYRMFFQPKTALKQAPTEAPTAAVETVNLPEIKSIVPEIDDNEWRQVIADPVLNAARVKRADGCNEAFGQVQQAFWTNNAERIPQIRQHTPQTFWGLKEFLCLEVGQNLPIYTFESKLDSPVVTHLATMKVSDIISIEIAKIPAAYYAAQNTNAQAFGEFLAAKRPASQRLRDNIIRLSGSVTEKIEPTKVPPVAANARTIFRASLPALRAKYPKLTIVDVRSAAEYAAGTISGAISAPFAPAPHTSNAFAFSVRNQDLANSTFNRAPILNAPIGQPIVIVGGPPTDGRAFWALHLLGNARDNLYFLYDGVN